MNTLYMAEKKKLPLPQKDLPLPEKELPAPHDMLIPEHAGRSSTSPTSSRKPVHMNRLQWIALAFLLMLVIGSSILLLSNTGSSQP
jgi:hypothetical protein